MGVDDEASDALPPGSRQEARLARMHTEALLGRDAAHGREAPQRASTQAIAQSESDPWAGVEEMVVTSSDVIDALTSSTVSVTAFDSSDLEAMGAADIVQLLGCSRRDNM